MQTRSLTASANEGTGDIESKEYIQTSSIFRESTPSSTREPGVHTKMVAPGQSFQRLISSPQQLSFTSTIKPPPAGTPRPVMSSPSACAAGALRGAASWFEPITAATQERFHPEPQNVPTRAQTVEPEQAELHEPKSNVMDRSRDQTTNESSRTTRNSPRCWPVFKLFNVTS